MIVVRQDTPSSQDPHEYLDAPRVRLHDHKSILTSVVQERQQGDAREREVGELVGKAGQKRASFRERVEDVVGLLDEKHEKLKEKHQDDGDDLSTFPGSLPAELLDDNSLENPMNWDEQSQDSILQERPRRTYRLTRRRRSQKQKGNQHEGFLTDFETTPSRRGVF
ncbi:hypothetical protein PQX77_015498 [Marasmius sp. AFHP31]|nr:hypothetical protein PQX77_015498 [Marasmius sp. AFHP31]